MLEINSLCVSFGKLAVLRGIDLKISTGETVGIIGPNGCGKTTLFNCISGFNPALSGEILYKQQNITELAPFTRARLGLGRVFQNSGVFRELSVFENVLIALESRQTLLQNLLPASTLKAENKAKAMNYLEMVELQDKAEQKAAALSGGQLRLLEIIRMVAFGAELFLLDEPTAGVSPKMKIKITEIIKKLKELNKTVMIIEHDLHFIQEFCTRIVVLDSGKVALEDSPDKIRGNPMLKEIYFGK